MMMKVFYFALVVVGRLLFLVTVTGNEIVSLHFIMNRAKIYITLQKNLGGLVCYVVNADEMGAKFGRNSETGV